MPTLARGNGRRLLRQPLLQRVDVLEQPGAGESQEIEAELRVLHVELLDLGVADAQHDAGLDAFQRLGAHFEGDSMPSSPTMAPTGSSMPDSTSRNRPLTM